MFLANYCGYNIHSDDSYVIYRPNGSETYLLLLFLAPMTVHFKNGVVETTKLGACLLYPPGCYQHYHAVKKFYNSYMHFYADEKFVDNYPLPVNEIFYPDNYEELNLLFQQISKEFFLRAPYREQKLNLLIQNLIIELSRASHNPIQETPAADRLLRSVFDEARLSILQSCHKDWSTDEMCSLVNLGKSQFFSYYKQFYNCTPREDLLAARLDKAKNLLTSQAMQVSQVAEACGFHNVFHFTRFFTKSCGVSPSQYFKIDSVSEHH